jgi:uncharacterized protein
MDRLFLDANVLFSAAYRANAGLLRLWKLGNTALCSSRYAAEEARINLVETKQRDRLTELLFSVELFDADQEQLPAGMILPQKDVPIMLAALAARATHLLTGDLRHFGVYFGQTIAGIRIASPGEYLKLRGLRR